MFPEVFSKINQVQVSMFDLNPLWEHVEAVRGQQPRYLHVDTPGWVMLNINHPFVLTTQIPPTHSYHDMQQWKTSCICKTLECNTLTPAMYPLVLRRLKLHCLVKSTNTFVQWGTGHSQALHLQTSLIMSHLRRWNNHSLTRFTRKLFISTTHAKKDVSVF